MGKPKRKKICRKQMICRTCGGVNVQVDAYAEWDVTKQAWEIATTFDKGAVCEDCDGECRIDERDATPAEIGDACDLCNATAKTGSTINPFVDQRNGNKLRLCGQCALNYVRSALNY